MSLKSGLIHCFVLLSFSTVSSAQNIDQLMWLEGTWQSDKDGNTFTEVWTVENDSTLSGNSTITQNGIEQFSESLSIESRNSSINYVAILPSKTAVFPLYELDDGSVSFLDPENDFPSTIIYRKTDLGLDIILKGNGSGHSKVEILHFQKK